MLYEIQNIKRQSHVLTVCSILSLIRCIYSNDYGLFIKRKPCHSISRLLHRGRFPHPACAAWRFSMQPPSNTGSSQDQNRLKKIAGAALCLISVRFRFFFIPPDCSGVPVGNFLAVSNSSVTICQCQYYQIFSFILKYYFVACLYLCHFDSESK